MSEPVGCAVPQQSTQVLNVVSLTHWPVPVPPLLLLLVPPLLEPGPGFGFFVPVPPELLPVPLEPDELVPVVSSVAPPPASFFVDGVVVDPPVGSVPFVSVPFG